MIMPVEEWALVASVAFAGIWSGLLAMLTTILQPMLSRMDGPGFERFLRQFLPVARTAPINSIAVLGMVIAPAIALVALIDDPGQAAFILAAVGLALTVAGPLLVSRYRSEPNYDEMLAWDPEEMPSTWEAGRDRYFELNWIRAAATWGAFALFLGALVTL